MIIPMLLIGHSSIMIMSENLDLEQSRNNNPKGEEKKEKNKIQAQIFEFGGFHAGLMSLRGPMGIGPWQSNRHGHFQ